MRCSTTLISFRVVLSKPILGACFPMLVSSRSPRTERGPVARSTRSAVAASNESIRAALASGRVLLSSGIWLVSHYGNLRRALQQSCPDVRHVAPVRCAAWHRGSRYFRVGLATGGECFVKTNGGA